VAVSKKVLNVSALAYTILCGLTSSTTLSPRLFTNFLKLRNEIFVSSSNPSKWFSNGMAEDDDDQRND
jgi:hypothetical protein